MSRTQHAMGEDLRCVLLYAGMTIVDVAAVTFKISFYVGKHETQIQCPTVWRQ